jgi:C-terminal region of Mon2 protein
LVLDEAIDCQVIEQLRDEVLPYSGEIPHQFILNVVVLLNKGSIHSATSASNSGCDAEMKLREEFAKTCFETLLQFSLLDESGNKEATSIQLTNNEGGVAGQLAITALLHRFEEVLKKFNDDERQSGKCPLPRYRLSEISFVLKAVATLIISMKKAPPTKGEGNFINYFKSFAINISYPLYRQSVKQHGNNL